ncbi:MAG: DUF2059 domain-containing protein [Victivallaceae bacterium]|nr:DUF2059 domain-containing protein [Victivallaceae bacterium]
MKKIILMLFAAGFIFTLAAAEQNDAVLREKLAGQLLDNLNIRKQITESFATVKDLQRQVIAKTLETAKPGQELTDFRNKALAVAEQELDWRQVQEALVKIYAQAYSVAELEKLNGFFLSPAGKAFLAKTPALQRQLILIIQKRMKATSRKIREMTREFMKAQMLKGETVMPESLKAPATTKPSGKLF